MRHATSISFSHNTSDKPRSPASRAIESEVEGFETAGPGFLGTLPTLREFGASRNLGRITLASGPDIGMQAEGEHAALTSETFEFFTDFDLHLFHEGTHYRAYEKLGGRLRMEGGVAGANFAVWAPNAQRVYVIGDFNDWNSAGYPLTERASSGIWSGFVPGAVAGQAYQFHIVSRHHGYQAKKTDPYALRQAPLPQRASVLWDLSYEWHDSDWMSKRGARNRLEAPVFIYELHLGSWRRVPEEGNRQLTFREAAPLLVDHVKKTGFTHVLFLPIMEHPAHGPHDYDISAYFAPAARYGSPQDLMSLIDTLHQNDIAVLLDWIPAYFPADDGFGLAYFDGTYLYESGASSLDAASQTPAQTFDLSRGEVSSFLLSNAFFWLDKYHADGLKADSASPLLHLDYARERQAWQPNPYGGRENVDGIKFLRQFNTEVHGVVPGVQTVVEEDTGWPNLTRPPQEGGLGFTLKWDNEFTGDMLAYFGQDPLFRKFQHHLPTRCEKQAVAENLLLPLGHGRRSLLSRMAGDEWQRFANLRLLLGYQYLQPGKKLLFMGTEFAQWRDWDRENSLDWHLAAHAPHAGMLRWVTDLNEAYRRERALHQSDAEEAGFEWVDKSDAERSTLSWLRRDSQRREVLLVVCNFTPVVRGNFHVGVRRAGLWREILNSDAWQYGGSGVGNFGAARTSPFSSHGFPDLLTLTLPPLAILVFKHEP